VHESIAASCPMFIHHLVPGQEQGNLELLQKIGAVHYTESPSSIKQALVNLLANNAAEWRQMKRNLQLHHRPAGASIAADFILKTIS